MKFAILNANRYSFPAKDTGEVIEGVSLHVLDLENTAAAKNDRRGPDVMKVSAEDSIWRDLAEVPGVYDCSVSIKPGKEKQVTLKVQGVKFLKGLDLGLAAAAKGA